MPHFRTPPCGDFTPDLWHSTGSVPCRHVWPASATAFGQSPPKLPAVSPQSDHLTRNYPTLGWNTYIAPKKSWKKYGIYMFAQYSNLLETMVKPPRFWCWKPPGYPVPIFRSPLRPPGPGVPIPTRGKGAPAPGDHRGLGACPPIKHGGFNGKYHYKWRCIAGEIVKLNGECSIATFDREGG